MLVSDYNIFIQNTQPRKTQNFSQNKKEQERFNFPKESSTVINTHISTPSLPIDYINTKNYFINKEQLKQKQEQSPSKKDPLHYYQKLSKIKKIPTSYNVAFTTFYDLSKPKTALNQTPKLQISTDYQQLQKQQLQNNMVATYIANDLYYKRTSA